MSHGDPLKWNLPGWRIEQKYSPGVLIGNWSESRHTFDKGLYKHNSTHRQDYRQYPGYKPDIIIRRQAMIRNDGLGKETLFTHHGTRYSNNMISWYDENYNKREREPNDRLPPLRDWDGHKLAWAPEKSDHPMQGCPTNFGLLKSLERKWDQQLANETRGDYISNYTVSYQPNPPQASPLRYGNPREQSTTLLKNNNLNKDLHLRNKSVLQLPETLTAVAL